MLVLPVKLKYIKIKYANRLQWRKTTAENPNKSELDFLSLPCYSGLTPNSAYRKTRHAVLSAVCFLICLKSFAVASSECYFSKQKENFNKSKKGLCSLTYIWAWDTIRLVSVSVSLAGIISPLQNTRTFSSGCRRSLPLGVFHLAVTLTIQSTKFCYLEMMLQFYQSFLSFLKLGQATLQDMSA